jgi:hypothetical protein
MKNYHVTVIRTMRTEVVYTAEICAILAESEDEARRKAELALPRLSGVEDEGWSESEPETTLSPPEIIHVVDEAELLDELRQLQGNDPD